MKTTYKVRKNCLKCGEEMVLSLWESSRKYCSRRCMGEANRGISRSEEVKKKIRITKLKRKERLGYVNSPETREKMGKSRIGKKLLPFSKDIKAEWFR